MPSQGKPVKNMQASNLWSCHDLTQLQWCWEAIQAVKDRVAPEVADGMTEQQRAVTRRKWVFDMTKAARRLDFKHVTLNF